MRSRVRAGVVDDTRVAQRRVDAAAGRVRRALHQHVDGRARRRRRHDFLVPVASHLAGVGVVATAPIDGAIDDLVGDLLVANMRLDCRARPRDCTAVSRRLGGRFDLRRHLQRFLPPMTARLTGVGVVPTAPIDGAIDDLVGDLLAVVTMRLEWRARSRDSATVIGRLGSGSNLRRHRREQIAVHDSANWLHGLDHRIPPSG